MSEEPEFAQTRGFLYLSGVKRPFLYTVTVHMPVEAKVGSDSNFGMKAGRLTLSRKLDNQAEEGTYCIVIGRIGLNFGQRLLYIQLTDRNWPEPIFPRTA